PNYGTLRDFENFLREAHRRGIRVIIELVLNHTSDQHPWFQRARRSPPGSRWRNFYVWSDTPDRYQEARLIFKDFESSNWAWDPEAKAYYWHRFYSHQPDLNYDSPDVRRAIERVIDFWLGMGVDGLRLDAVPYLFERDDSICENLPETHQALKEIRRYVDKKYPNRLLLAEANQWPEDASAYFGDGDECHMAFHFPLMPRLFMGIRMEDRFPIVEILRQTPKIPDICQWALFLRNHDELTLEMVTDEERDYMNRVYAQDPEMRINLGIRRRLAPLLRNNRRQMELMNALLFSMPGTPVIYYGDELAMGDNVYLGDRNGVRTPMQWNADRNAGFSRANPQKLYLPVIIDPEYHYESVNVEAQQNNPHWFLWWTKRLLALRKRYKAFGRGNIQFLFPENRKVLAFVRQYEEQTVLVVANLSRFVQAVELDMGAFAGLRPVEMFGRTEFPTIGESPYFLSLGPHAFYWFSLEPARVDGQYGAPPVSGPQMPRLGAPLGLESLLAGTGKYQLESILPNYLRGARWFAGKARSIRSASIADAVPIISGRGRPRHYLTFVRVDYFEGESETYALPLGLVTGDQATSLATEAPQTLLAWVQLDNEGKEGALFDATWDRSFALGLLEAMAKRRNFKSASGELRAQGSLRARQTWNGNQVGLEPTVLKGEQSNTSIIYGDKLILKLFRKMDVGVNPDLEIGRYLTERTKLSGVPAVAGALALKRSKQEHITVGILHEYIHNEG
ncbi:MAG TPA: maltose alpha-D-glucosyltransferase, partial [Dehalococcoidia bacterium]|nr:maltose alpha-D-glucosyltransferase [Dehalococcoidia bacterium]